MLSCVSLINSTHVDVLLGHIFDILNSLRRQAFPHHGESSRWADASAFTGDDSQLLPGNGYFDWMICIVATAEIVDAGWQRFLLYRSGQ